MKISVVVHTFNSEKTLQKCLDSVKNFDEIVLCDMYSEDSTLSIAKEYNCKIIMHEHCGFVEPARNFAIQATENEWVFIVDSDEAVPEELKNYLYSITDSENPADAYLVPRRNFFMNRFMHSAYPDYQFRFFKKKDLDWPPYVHARPQIKGKVKKIPAKKKYSFIHFDENRISSLLLKYNTYTDKEILRRKGKKSNFFMLIFKPAFVFFKFYILKGGFRDGKSGFIFSKLKAFYKFISIAKILENKEIEC